MTVSHPSMRRAKVDPKPVREPEVYVVENATNQPHENTDILAANEQAALHKSEAPKPEIKEMSLLEDLLFLGSAKKEIIIGKVKFEISTITQKENSELAKELYKVSDGGDLFAIRALTLAYAIRCINGVPFDEVPLTSLREEAEFSTVLEKKLYILERMQKNIVEKIHDEFISLVESSDEVLKDGGEKLKN